VGYLALYDVGVGVGCVGVVISMDTKKRRIAARKKGKGKKRRRAGNVGCLRESWARTRQQLLTRYMRFSLNDHFAFFSIFAYGIIRILFVQILKWIRQDSSNIAQAL